MGWRLNGKRVSVIANPDSIGAWAEYHVFDAKSCIPLDDKLSFEQGACAFVNPLTVCAFIELLKDGKHKACVSSAAASQLGRMLIKNCKDEGIKTINLVRREEQKKELLDLGADYVINTSDKDFEDQLKKLAKE